MAESMPAAVSKVEFFDLPATASAWLISDLHLWSDRPNTFARFTALLDRAVEQASCLLILGDLFEYWAGDDDLAAEAVAPVVAALHAATARGLRIGVMHGNRDFLLGADFARATGVQLLADQCLLQLGDQRYLLLHGDTLCTDDVDYQRFRAQVRDPAYQRTFMQQPLAARHALIAQLRARSEDKKSRAPAAIMDVNKQAVDAAFSQHQVDWMIHGHTHRPARHQLGQRTRWVLSDWDYDEPGYSGGRGDGLAVTALGVKPVEA